MHTEVHKKEQQAMKLTALNERSYVMNYKLTLYEE